MKAGSASAAASRSERNIYVETPLIGDHGSVAIFNSEVVRCAILMRNCCLFLVAGRSCDVDFWMGVEGERDLKHYTEGEGGAKKQ